jgi:thymidylate synthase
MIIAKICGLEYGDFVWTGGDVHLYSNHFEQAKLQIARKNEIRDLPEMKLGSNVNNIDDLNIEDFELINYNPHDAIKAPIAV